MYVPKNRIRTNLYTRGGEYQAKANQQPYAGYYHVLYNGKIYSGKNPNDAAIFELEKVDTSPLETTPYELSPQNKIALFINDGDPAVAPGEADSPSLWNQGDIVSYLKSTQQPLNDDNPRDTPQPYYPQPTPEDYAYGSFIRYFLIKINEVKFVEIDKATYDNFDAKKKSVVFELYTPFKLPWTITGVEKEVEQTNYNIVLLAEQRLNRLGLREYLRGNYLKFYKS